jgi:CheY-like chemotaxis protein
VLVVDDSDDVRECIALRLRFCGYEVIEASDGRQAVELAIQGCPALIVMDIQMPVMDGLTATRMIRQVEGLCGVAIVAFSAFGPEYGRRAFEAGCDEYVCKDEGVGRLAGVVGRYLRPTPPVSPLTRLLSGG